MNPTSHQQQIIDSVIDSLQNGQSCCLSGKAGVGKTFCLSFIIEKLERFRTVKTGYKTNYTSNFIFTSPTHKASQTASVATGKTFVTLASLLKKKKEINYETGQVLFDSTVQECDGQFYIVVDEASMISDEDERVLLKNFPNSTFLFVGDKHQLPAILERKVDIFQSYPCHELTVNMRCGMGNPLHDYIEDVCTNGIDVQIMDSERVFIIDKQALTPDDTVVCYFNQTCQAVNKFILDKFFEGKLQVGVKLVSNENINYQPGGYRIYNSQFLEIQDIKQGRIIIYHDAKQTEVGVYNIETNRGPVVIPSDGAFQKILDSYKDTDWKKYFKIKAMCHDVSLGYGITSHKVQGSTFTEITVLRSDIIQSPVEVRNQSYYVAVSRAAEKLKIII